MNELPAIPAPELTHDALHLFSPRYRGLSPRLEMWLCLIIFQAFYTTVGVLGALNVYTAVVVIGLFTVFFSFPLHIRRARQMGAVWYGVLVIVLSRVVLPLTFLLLVVGDARTLFAQLAPLMSVLVLLPLPLYLWGGALAGRKNELMRAAIDGDAERARRLLEECPQLLLQKSDKGLTARDYAERLGHHALASWLLEQEQTPITTP